MSDSEFEIRAMDPLDTTPALAEKLQLALEIIIAEHEEKLEKQTKKKEQQLRKREEITKIHFALDADQRKEILSLAEGPGKKTHYMLMKTQMETGLRVGELAHLLIEDINFATNEITVRDHDGKRYKKHKLKTLSSGRPVPISQDLSHDLSMFLGNRTTGYVFISKKHCMYNTRSICKIINGYAKRCKTLACTIGTHSLRRTYASYLLLMKVDLLTISKLLGHKNTKVTLRYLCDITNKEEFDNVRETIAKMNPRPKLPKRKAESPTNEVNS